MKYLTNAPYNPCRPREHTILILEDDPEWAAAYAQWLAGAKYPTPSPEWQRGVYFGFCWEQR